MITFEEIVKYFLPFLIGGGGAWLFFWKSKSRQYTNTIAKEEFDQVEDMVDNFSKKLFELSKKLGEVTQKNMEIQERLADLYNENNRLKEDLEKLRQENEKLKEKIKQLHNESS